ncbi:MAG: AAA family ATPase [Verrucomicrobiota bacterium]
MPGLAKTLFARALAATLHVSFRRIQFTPDLMPSRPHRHQRLSARHAHLQVPARPDLQRRPARRRNQPHAAQDAVRAARGDGGTPGQRSTASRVPCPSTSSSSPRRTDRVRGHVPAARGARPTASSSRSRSTTPPPPTSSPCCSRRPSPARWRRSCSRARPRRTSPSSAARSRR